MTDELLLTRSMKAVVILHETVLETRRLNQQSRSNRAYRAASTRTRTKLADDPIWRERNGG